MYKFGYLLSCIRLLWDSQIGSASKKSAWASEKKPIKVLNLRKCWTVTLEKYFKMWKLRHCQSFWSSGKGNRKYQSRTYQNLLYLGHSPMPEIFRAKQQSLHINHISQRYSSNARVELRDAVALPSQKPCEEPTKQHLLLSVLGLHKTWAIMIWKPRSLAASIIPVPLLMSWFKLDLQEQPLSWK